MSARRQGVVAFILVSLVCSFTYFTTGLFVMQPIGALPEGATVWYWRFGTSLPFISSADGLLLEKQGSVSLLGRAVALGVLAEPVAGRKIVALPYSRTLYLITTGGREFER
jgi:hypothetical protein